MGLNDRLKEAFDKIQADDELKAHTREYILQKTHGYRRSMAFSYNRLIAVTACFLFILLGWSGYSVYFTPISSISVDINPSIEIGINRFDKVISVETYNEDGYMIMSSMDIHFLDYKEALEQILSDESMAQYLTQDQFITITVFGRSEEKNNEMLASLTTCTNSYKNICYFSGNSEEVAAAHSAGMSFGKYKAFLKLQALDPDIMLEDVKELTMHQIWDMINALSNDKDDTIQNNDLDKKNCRQNSSNGSENGHCNRQKMGNGHRH